MESSLLLASPCSIPGPRLRSLLSAQRRLSRSSLTTSWENLRKAQDAGYETAERDFRDDAELAKLGLGDTIKHDICLFLTMRRTFFHSFGARTCTGIRIFSIAHGQSAVPNLHAAGAKQGHRDGRSAAWHMGYHYPPDRDLDPDHTLFGQANLNVTGIEDTPDHHLSANSWQNSKLRNSYNLILVGMGGPGAGGALRLQYSRAEGRLQAGDILVVIGTGDASAGLRRDLQPEWKLNPHPSTRSDPECMNSNF